MSKQRNALLFLVCILVACVAITFMRAINARRLSAAFGEESTTALDAELKRRLKDWKLEDIAAQLKAHGVINSQRYMEFVMC